MTVISLETKRAIGQAYTSREEAADDALAELKALRAATTDEAATYRLAKVSGIIKALRSSTTQNPASDPLDALARLVAHIRPSWGVPGIRKALGQCKADLCDVTVAAVRAAREESNRTPAVIPLAGPHWPAARRPVVPLAERVEEFADEMRSYEQETVAARESRRRAREACGRCDDRGRLGDGRFCDHGIGSCG